jgi:Ala-tRNA(Pro) deacylase
MSLSPTLEHYLTDRQIHYGILDHAHSGSSMQSAHAAHIAPDQLAKAVVVKYRENYMMCVLPATHMLMLNWLDRDYSGRYQLVDEAELARLFPDCEAGAVPPLGEAYGMKVVWDNRLQYAREVYLEGGDHRHLISVRHDDFISLMGSADHAAISCTPETADYYRHVH